LSHKGCLFAQPRYIAALATGESTLVRLAFRRAEPPWTLYADCPPPVLHIFYNNDHPGVYYHRHDHGPRRIRHHWHSQAEAASKEVLKLPTIDRTTAKDFISLRHTCQHFRKISSARQLAFWRIRQVHRVLPVSTHSASSQGACMHAPTPDCRKPKLTHSPASISCTQYASTTTHRLDYGAHIRFSLHNYRLPALDTSLGFA
jgi:hypothetical protein